MDSNNDWVQIMLILAIIFAFADVDKNAETEVAFGLFLQVRELNGIAMGGRAAIEADDVTHANEGAKRAREARIGIHGRVWFILALLQVFDDVTDDEVIADDTNDKRGDMNEFARGFISDADFVITMTDLVKGDFNDGLVVVIGAVIVLAV